jgi:hypothetical protein
MLVCRPANPERLEWSKADPCRPLSFFRPPSTLDPRPRRSRRLLASLQDANRFQSATGGLRQGLRPPATFCQPSGLVWRGDEHAEAREYPGVSRSSEAAAPGDPPSQGSRLGRAPAFVGLRRGKSAWQVGVAGGRTPTASYPSAGADLAVAPGIFHSIFCFSEIKLETVAVGWDSGPYLVGGRLRRRAGRRRCFASYVPAAGGHEHGSGAGPSRGDPAGGAARQRGCSVLNSSSFHPERVRLCGFHSH